MKSLPKITVITPSYNQGKFIERTIKSVVSQNYPNLEYIIMDAGSSDNTLNIIKKYSKLYPEVISWVSNKDRGQADAINKGIKKSKGDILTYLNSDDTQLPGTLAAVGKYFSQSRGAKWLTGDYFIIDEKDKKIQSYIVFYKRLFRTFPGFLSLSLVNYIAQPSTYWRKEISDEIGLFDITQHLVLDYDFWLRIIRKYPLHIVNRPLSNFRIHNASKGKSDYKIQFEQGYEIVKRYTNNPLLLLLHKLHAGFIIVVYKLIK